jgi:hypothetical protein
MLNEKAITYADAVLTLARFSDALQNWIEFDTSGDKYGLEQEVAEAVAVAIDDLLPYQALGKKALDDIQSINRLTLRPALDAMRGESEEPILLGRSVVIGIVESLKPLLEYERKMGRTLDVGTDGEDLDDDERYKRAIAGIPSHIVKIIEEHAVYGGDSAVPDKAAAFDNVHSILTSNRDATIDEVIGHLDHVLIASVVLDALLNEFGLTLTLDGYPKVPAPVFKKEAIEKFQDMTLERYRFDRDNIKKKALSIASTAFAKIEKACKGESRSDANLAAEEADANRSRALIGRSTAFADAEDWISQARDEAIEALGDLV